MTRVLIISFIFACCEVAFICNLKKASSRASFELVSGEQDATMTSLFHKSFHQCSLDDDCNFVAQNKETNSYKKFYHQINLPKDMRKYVIFMKKRDVKYQSCQSLLKAGRTSSGKYEIWMDGKQMEVYCDMETDGGGWIVIQRRKDNTTDFYREALDYQKGFGDKNKNFWLGMKNIHALTSNGAMLRVDLIDLSGKTGFAKYNTFKVGDVGSDYKLEISGYSGNAGDSLAVHNNMKFSTKDIDNDMYSGNCASACKGAWWYKACYHSHLNGLFPTAAGGKRSSMMSWYHLSNKDATIIFSEMKVRSLTQMV